MKLVKMFVNLEGYIIFIASLLKKNNWRDSQGSE